MREKINNYTLTRPRTKKVIGWGLVVIGFIALIAPIIPGAPLIFFGLEVLGLRLLLTDKIKRFVQKYILRPEEVAVAIPVSETEEPANQPG